MSDRWKREPGDAKTAALRNEGGAERYERRQREIRNGRARANGARPPDPGFLERVARLLRGR